MKRNIPIFNLFSCLTWTSFQRISGVDWEREQRKIKVGSPTRKRIDLRMVTSAAVGHQRSGKPGKGNKEGLKSETGVWAGSFQWRSLRDEMLFLQRSASSGQPDSKVRVVTSLSKCHGPCQKGLKPFPPPYGHNKLFPRCIALNVLHESRTWFCLPRNDIVMSHPSQISTGEWESLFPDGVISAAPHRGLRYGPKLRH